MTDLTIVLDGDDVQCATLEDVFQEMEDGGENEGIVTIWRSPESGKFCFALASLDQDFEVDGNAVTSLYYLAEH